MALDSLTIAQQGIQGTSLYVALQGLWDGTDPTPTPRPPSGFAVEIGDGYLRYGNVIRWLRRPKDLEPVRAEMAAVRKIEKRLGVSKEAAQQVVDHAQRELGSNLNYLRAADLATSGGPEKYTRSDISEMRRYWVEVIKLAAENEDEDDAMLLLS